MPKIVLGTINAKWIHPSYALRLLKANLGKLEDHCEILEFALRQPLEEKVRPILERRPRILALSVYIWNHRATAEWLTELRRRWSSADGLSTETDGSPFPTVILGGPEVSFLKDDAGLIKMADYVVQGEGEGVFRSLCTAILSGQGPRRRWIQGVPADLGSIDPAYRLYTREDLEKKLTYVEASRGCPFGCHFCLSSLDRSVRTVPLTDFLNQLQELIDRGGRSFKFLDRTFNLDIDRARAIMEFFLQRLRPGMFVHFEMVPSRFPEALQSLLTQFPPGTLRLEVGIQTLNSQVARTIGRPSDPERELETLEFLRRRTRAIVHADLIAGLPGETMESFAEGFNRLWAVRPTEIQVGVLKKLPGTPLAQHDVSYGMRYSDAPPYEVLETRTWSAADMDRIKNFARFWELIVNRGNFDDLVPSLLSDDAFGAFMRISEGLLRRFGKSWGIDRGDLRSALMEANVEPGVGR
jgi:radical SAM superfamily enzyme YgiQ (UPF0313 family)